MIFDSAKLGYTAQGVAARLRTFVHYPKRDAAGNVAYGAGLEFEFPSWYAVHPPNDITRERVGLVAQLAAASPSSQAEA